MPACNHNAAGIAACGLLGAYGGLLHVQSYTVHSYDTKGEGLKVLTS